MLNTPNTDSSINPSPNLMGSFHETLGGSSPLAVATAPTNPSPVGSSGVQLTFIDTNVEDYQQLADSIIVGDVIFLDATRDGITQITETLAQYDNVTGLSLVSHGEAGSLKLGNSVLDSQTLSRYQQDFQSWGEALTAEADILLYGCNVAAGDIGSDFVTELGILTGADIAASTDLTGNAARQGDWDLEFMAGTIEANSTFGSSVATAYEGVLATYGEVSTLKIMPLGDSLTNDNDPRYDGYRRDLWKQLIAGGYSKVDFVGGVGSVGPNNDFDLNNEGHPGWRADQILSKVTSYVKTHNPDVVLLGIGTNDMNQNQSISGTINEISQIIDKLRAHNPNIAVLLSKISPGSTGGRWNGNGIQALANAIPALAQSKNKAGSPVILVDQNSGYSVANDTHDGLHPNNSGQAKMANKWYAALDGLFKSGHQYKRDGSGTTLPPSNGLRAEYYDNHDFTNLKLTRTDANVNFNWGAGSPSSNIGANSFSVRWTGQIQPLYSETYTFHTNVDDGVRLTVNGQTIIDKLVSINDGAPAAAYTGSINLVAGQKYDIKMEYYEDGSNASAQLAWSSASQAQQIIPQSQLFNGSGTTTGGGTTGGGTTGGGTTGGGTTGGTTGSGNGLRGQYYDNHDFTNLKLTRTDANVDFNWGAGSPSSNIGANSFSVRWTGQVQPLFSETYTFQTNADDGIRLTINGQTIIDKLVSLSDGSPAAAYTGSINLVAGQKYDIQLEYYEDGSNASAQLLWSSASQAQQIIPKSQLFS
jgi:lysophospholipase L1-like esterase